jgi:hypothetical protein
MELGRLHGIQEEEKKEKKQSHLGSVFYLKNFTLIFL